MKTKKIFSKLILMLLLVILLAPSATSDAKTKSSGLLSVSLEKHKLHLYVGDSAPLSSYYTYDIGTGPGFDFTWSSSNKKVATVSVGQVTAIAPGTATITVKCGKLKDSCKVTVTKTALQKKMDAKIDAIIKRTITSSMTSVEKVQAIHDYIISATIYDYDNYLAGTVPDASYTGEGVLLDKTGVCQGYALAFQAIMDRLRIPCQVIYGTANGPHAWNMVQLNNDWYWVDLTFDDPAPDNGLIFNNYFLLSDDELCKDHFWDSSMYSAKGGDYLYYGFYKYWLTSIDEIPAIMQAQKDQSSITIACPSEIKDTVLQYAAAQYHSITNDPEHSYYYDYAIGNVMVYQFFIKKE